jgi:hypothetical protein
MACLLLRASLLHLAKSGRNERVTVAANTTGTPLTDNVKKALHEFHNCVQEITMEVHLAEQGHTRKTFKYTDLISAVDLMNRSLEDLRASVTNLQERLVALKIRRRP